MFPHSRFRSLAAIAAAGLLALPLAACSMIPGAPAVSSAPSGAETESFIDGSMDTVLPATDAAATAERSIIRTANLALEVGDPDAAVDEVSGVAADMGGSVESLNVSEVGEGSRADLVLRVPSDRLDEAVDALSEVGTVLSESRTAHDVTTEHVDLKARVAALEDSVKRLRELMSGAASTTELLEAESALSQRQQEFDGLRAQLESLEGQVEESTIAVSLSAPSVLPGGGPANFWEGLVAGVQSLGVVGAGALVALGVLLPWLVVAGVIALVVIGIVRWAARRRRARAASAEGVPQQVEGQVPADYAGGGPLA